MEYRRMGRSGLQLSVLSYGSWVTFHKQINDNSADELMGIAYDNGINFFDNAEGYAFGESEKMMGRVLKAKNWDRTSYTISSKVFFGWRKDNKPNQTGLSRKHITEACHEALGRLQSDYLDLYFCHRPDTGVPIEEVVWTMHNLIQQGKVLYWGTSQWSAAEIMEAHRVAQQYHLIAPTVEQPQYNMFERFKMEQDYLPVFKNVGLGTTIWSPLAAGFLTGKYNDGIPEDSRLAIEGFDWLKTRWIQEAKLEKVKKLTILANELGVSLAALNVTPLLTDELMQQIEAILQNKPIMDLA
jgi:voltage-dependent potassium channel beta subunit